MDCLFSVFDICFGRRETAPCLRTYVRTYHTFPTSANWQQTHTVPGIISVVGPLIFAAWTTQQHNQWSNGQISRWLVRLARRVWKRYRIAVRCKWPVAERVHANRTLPAYVTPGIHDHEQTGQGYLHPCSMHTNRSCSLGLLSYVRMVRKSTKKVETSAPNLARSPYVRFNSS